MVLEVAIRFCMADLGKTLEDRSRPHVGSENRECACS